MISQRQNHAKQSALLLTIVIIRKPIGSESELGQRRRGDALVQVSASVALYDTSLRCVRRTVPVHTRPPLQPPSRQELGPGVPLLKLQSRRAYDGLRMAETMFRNKTNWVRTQMRPAVQLSGTEKETVWNARCSQLDRTGQRYSNRTQYTNVRTRQAGKDESRRR